IVKDGEATGQYRAARLGPRVGCHHRKYVGHRIVPPYLVGSCVCDRDSPSYREDVVRAALVEHATHHVVHAGIVERGALDYPGALSARRELARVEQLGARVVDSAATQRVELAVGWEPHAKRTYHVAGA